MLSNLFFLNIFFYLWLVQSVDREATDMKGHLCILLSNQTARQVIDVTLISVSSGESFWSLRTTFFLSNIVVH
jgi:hypothetical protein